MRQARVIDIHEYWRTGGTDWARLKANFDVVGIRACVGEDVDELLVEHVDQAKAHGVPYYTYCVPLASLDPGYQAEFYLDQYGVGPAPKVWDVEPTGGMMVNAVQARELFELVPSAWLYSNEYYLKQLGVPAWLQDVDVVWLAQYYYQVYPFKYRKFEPFLDKYPWRQPSSAGRLGLTATLWQFTDYGDARFYCANDVTDDPDWREIFAEYTMVCHL